MITHYEYLDFEILLVIAAKQPVTFSRLFTNPVRVHSEALAEVRDTDDADRVVARRLQALRKAGRIKYQRKPEGWVLVQAEG